MADVAKLPFGEALLVEHLRGLSKALDATHEPHSAEFIRQGIALIYKKAAEIERMTPRPMTLVEACEIFNELSHRGYFWAPGEIQGKRFAETQYGGGWYSEFDAIAVAQRLVREKEAARG